MALPIPGLPELFVALAMFLFYAVFLLGLVALGVRIALAFMDHPESEEIQKRVALLERKVDRLESQVEAGEDTPDGGE